MLTLFANQVSLKSCSLIIWIKKCMLSTVLSMDSVLTIFAMSPCLITWNMDS